MKTLGLIGGMSWESSKVYYEIINRHVKKLLGGFHSCQSVMYSVDFAQIEILQSQDQWDKLDSLMVDAAQRVERAGADITVLCTNTMHLSSRAMEENTSIPLLHIARATGKELAKQEIKTAGLLGTRFTMEGDLYQSILREEFGIAVLVPGSAQRQVIHQVIYQELVQGIVTEQSREKYKNVIQSLANKGADSVILGCTEIPLLISQEDASIPVFDTTRIHAESAVQWAISA